MRASTHTAVITIPTLSKHKRRPWPKREGPFDHTPKRPHPGATLRYFEAEEGLVALQGNALLRGVPPADPRGSAAAAANDAPPAAEPLPDGSPAAAASMSGERSRMPVQPASPGRQYLPGIYLSATPHLSDDPTIATATQRRPPPAQNRAPAGSAAQPPLR